MRTYVVLIAALVSACGIPGLSTRGSGEAASRVAEVGAFHGVAVNGALTLNAEVAANWRVEIQGDSNLLDKVVLELDAGVLHARTKGSIATRLPLVVTVQAPQLDQIELSGASIGQIRGITGATLAVNLSGASEADVQGTVTEFKAVLSGASELRATELVADRVEVHASGASEADVTANMSIRGHASGASDVTWAGDAKDVEVDVSGASDMKRR